ncbi:MAG: UDP-glucose:(heptosyl)LPS alpha-1,3-glucosyltransferase [Paracoccaceae bacterium]|jgi:UDP-glucose:(heptosyl)LPS alpha-1,3-glucosyltransferase
MKFAIIRSECSYSKGGAERYAANLCRQLCVMGHQVWVLAEIFDPEIHPGIIHIPIRVNRTTSATRNHSFNDNAQRAVKELEIDQVIALSRSYPSDAFRVSDPLHCYWMGLRYPGKIRNFIERLNPRHRAILKLERAIMNPKNTRIIVTNSQLSKTLIEEYYDYPKERIHVIYNGVDHAQFAPSPVYQEAEELKFLFVGQDFKRKGLDPVIRAFATTYKAGHPCRLRVIGRDEPAPYRELAKQLGVADLIDFEGPTRAIQNAYQSADLFVFPSLYDPFANVVLESLACGLPALTTTTNGSSEIITENKNGYVVEGATDHLAADLADRMISFCQLSPENRKAMREASRTTAEKYSVAHNAETFVEKLTS